MMEVGLSSDSLAPKLRLALLKRVVVGLMAVFSVSSVVYFSIRTVSVFIDYRVLEYSDLSPGEELSDNEFNQVKSMIEDQFPSISLRNTIAQINYGNVLNRDYSIPSSRYRFKAIVLLPFFRYCMSEKRGLSLVMARTDFRRFNRSVADSRTPLDNNSKARIVIGIIQSF